MLKAVNVAKNVNFVMFYLLLRPILVQKMMFTRCDVGETDGYSRDQSAIFYFSNV